MQKHTKGTGGPVDFRIREANSHSWVSELNKEKASTGELRTLLVRSGVRGSRSLGGEGLPPTR